MERMRACAYCRVSTLQEKQESSIATQIQYFYDKFENDPTLINAGIYVDPGISGRYFAQRKEFQRMLKDCKAGKIDVVYCKSLTRFGRSTIQTLQVIEMLKELGIPVIFEMENINSLTDSGLALAIHSYLAQDEVEKDIQYVRASTQRQMGNGKICLNGNDIYGYAVNYKEQTYTIKPDEAKVVVYIYESYLKGHPSSRIAKDLNEQGHKTIKGRDWTSATVMGILRNEKYKGDVCLNKAFRDERGMRHRNKGEQPLYYTENSHEPIVSKEVWEKAQEVRLANTKASFSTAIYHEHDPFRVMIKCGCCGVTFRRSRRRKSNNPETNIGFRCGTCDKFGIRACQNNKAIKIGTLKDTFIATYNKLFDISKDITFEKYCRNAELDTIDNELQGLLNKEKIFIQMNANDLLTRKLKADYNQVIKRILELQEQKRHICRKDIDIMEQNCEITKTKQCFETYGKLTEFNEDAFVTTVKQIIVHNREEFEFIFKCGVSITIKLIYYIMGKDEIVEVIVNGKTNG